MSLQRKIYLLVEQPSDLGFHMVFVQNNIDEILELLVEPGRCLLVFMKVAETLQDIWSDSVLEFP